MKNPGSFLVIKFILHVSSIRNMPNFAIHHLKARKIICAACGKKDKNCLDLEENETLFNLVKSGANEDLDVNNLKEPTGLCYTCKSYLYQKKKNEKQNEFRETKLLLTKYIIETLPRFKGNIINNILI
jgi:hypothetical protein